MAGFGDHPLDRVQSARQTRLKADLTVPKRIGPTLRGVVMRPAAAIAVELEVAKRRSGNAVHAFILSNQNRTDNIAADRQK